MISLITGLPGSGKTSLMVYMLMTRKDLQNRPLYVDGIPDLKIPTEPIPDGESMETWHKWAPTGAVLVIDEAQRVFRPRPPGAKVPEHIQELETHRHKGVDIFILTQHPRLIDVNLRSLIGEHRNISTTLIGLKRLSYWQRCANPESRTDIAEAKHSVFFAKKAAYGMYKSAEEHTKLNRKISNWVYILPLVVLGVVFGYARMKHRYEVLTTPESQQQQVQQTTNEAAQTPPNPMQAQPTQTAVSAPVQPYDTPYHTASAPAQPPLTKADFEPSIDGQPWTAPVYDGLNRNIQSMPYPVGCVKSGKKCTCYTEQSTVIEDLEKGFCEKAIKNGLYNPYLGREQIQPARAVN